LEEAEKRVAMGHACVADSLSVSAPPVLSTGPEELLEAKSKSIERRTNAIRTLQEATTPLEQLVDQLCSLRAAAAHKSADFERTLLQRPTTESALQSAKRGGMRGAAAIICVLAQLCGNARIAFLLLDNNHNGRISMCEFDNSLRNKLSLDYEAITDMKLRPLFRILDRQKRGVLTEEDLQRCCPEIWEEYGSQGAAEPPSSQEGGRATRNAGAARLAYLAACRVEDQVILAARSSAALSTKPAIEAACKRLLAAAKTTLKGGSQQIVDSGGGRFRMAYALDRERQFMTILTITSQSYPERLAYRCIRELLGTVHDQFSASAKSSSSGVRLDRELGPHVQGLLERYEASGAAPGAA
jgi:hypothetical protein